MTNDSFKSLSKGMLRLMWLGALSSWIVYGIYIYNFAPGHWFKLSKYPSDWGVFGDYIGGTLNPFFSFLAFIGVVITVILQAKQLDIVREQSKLEEIQRVLSTLSSRIDTILSSYPNAEIVNNTKSLITTDSIYILLSAIGIFNLKKIYGKLDLPESLMDSHIINLQKTIQREITILGLELETLAWTLNQYSNENGNKLVMEFYKYRYRPILVWLDASGLIKSHGQIHQFFNPKESYKYMI